MRAISSYHYARARDTTCYRHFTGRGHARMGMPTDAFSYPGHSRLPPPRRLTAISGDGPTLHDTPNITTNRELPGHLPYTAVMAICLSARAFPVIAFFLPGLPTRTRRRRREYFDFALKRHCWRASFGSALLAGRAPPRRRRSARNYFTVIIDIFAAGYLQGAAPDILKAYFQDYAPRLYSACIGQAFRHADKRCAHDGR